MIETLITSSALIIGVCLLRLLLRGRVSPTVLYAMWAAPALRLLLWMFYPVSQWLKDLESPLSVMNAVGNLNERVIAGTGMGPLVDNVLTGRVRSYSNPETFSQKMAGVDWQLVIMAVWLAGSIILLSWILWVNIRFISGIRRERVRYRGSTYGATAFPVYCVPGLKSPCILTVLGETAIYLPSELKAGPKQLRHILAHESCHVLHQDLAWGALRCMLVCFYWVNPFVWLAAYLSKQDCELACDEAAVRQLGEEERFEYGRTLIGMTAGGQGASELFCLSSELGYGPGTVKKRIKLLAAHPRMTGFSAALVLAAVFLLIVCTYTGKVEDGVQRRTEQWAGYFCARDGKKLAAMYNPDHPEDFYDMEPVIAEENGEYSGFGWSSPWPMDDRYKIEVDGSRSQITYYAMTSEPHLWVWKETLDWEEIAGIFYVDRETFSIYNAIRTAEEFEAAYGLRIEGTNMDYRTNGLGQSLNENAARDPGRAPYQMLYSPETAGPFLLNLDGGQAVPGKDGDIGGIGEKNTVEYRFGDGSSIVLRMVQPFGADGIWVPAEWSERERDSGGTDPENTPVNAPDGENNNPELNDAPGGEGSGEESPEAGSLEAEAVEVIRQFAEAYFRSDAEGMARLMTDEAAERIEPYREDVWEQLDTFQIKGDLSAANRQNEMEIQCEFKEAKEDSFTYLGVELARDGDSWQVSGYYLEK